MRHIFGNIMQAFGSFIFILKKGTSARNNLIVIGDCHPALSVSQRLITSRGEQAPFGGDAESRKTRFRTRPQRLNKSLDLRWRAGHVRNDYCNYALLSVLTKYERLRSSKSYNKYWSRYIKSFKDQKFSHIFLLVNLNSHTPY